MELKGSRTEANLMAAFAGESQARNKYTYYASKAKKDGYVQIANIFEETAANEKEHAKIWFKLLQGGSIKDTLSNLMDAATGEQLAFKNVLVQFTHYETRDAKGYLAFQCHDDTKDGWYFTNGKGIHVTWKKTGDYAPTKYYDDNGNEIELNTGKTNICIVQDGKTFDVE